MISPPIKLFRFLGIGILVYSLLFTAPAIAKENKPPNEQVRLERFLLKVYSTMDDNYYLPVSREAYEDFVKTRPATMLRQLNDKTKQTEDYIHLGAGLLVKTLKSPSDIFTNFVPPTKVKAFKQTAYAVTEDLGIEGVKIADGFEITRIQKHCEAFKKGVRRGDMIFKIDGRLVASLDEAAIVKKMSPVVGTRVLLELKGKLSGKIRRIVLKSQSYFKDTVFALPSPVPGVLILKISHFNQATSPDFAAEISDFGQNKMKHLILDLRNNEGGPPLAAREILGFFCPVNDQLFAIARKRQRPVMLTAPPQPTVITAPVTVLVNRRTGSASEMFSGILQAKKIAVLVGQRTAGATYLKSIYDFDDGSMVFMITSLTYFYDRRVYPPEGLTPDILLPDSQDALEAVLGKMR